VSTAPFDVTAAPTSLPDGSRVPGKFGVTGVEVALAATAAILVSGSYLAIAGAHGALGVARNDDWVYLRSAFSYAESGRFEPDSYTLTMLVGLVVAARPLIAAFGPEIVPLQVMAALFAAVGLWAAYLVIRSMLPRGWSAFAVAVTALGPLYGALGTTFMTDVPAFALSMLALLAGVRALRCRPVSIGWYLAALGAGLAAFAVREYAAGAAAAVVVAAVWSSRAGSRRRIWFIVGISALWLLLAAALYLWRRSLADGGTQFLEPINTETYRTVVNVALTLALLTAPLAPLVSLPRLLVALRPQRWLAAVVLIGVIAAWVRIATSSRHMFLGNYVTPEGPYTVTLAGAQPQVIDVALWRVLTLVALASLLVLSLLTVVRCNDLARARFSGLRSLGEPGSEGRLLTGLFVLLTLGVLIGVKALTTAPLFDRYLLPVAPFVVALGLRIALDRGLVVRAKRLVATLSLAAFALFGLTIVDTAAAFDGAKWRLARAVESLGYEAPSIDGGYEWYGFHQPGAIAPRAGEAGRNFWIALFDARPVCVTSTFADGSGSDVGVSDPEVIAQVEASGFLLGDYRLVAVAGPDTCSLPTNPERVAAGSLSGREGARDERP